MRSSFASIRCVIAIVVHRVFLLEVDVAVTLRFTFQPALGRECPTRMCLRPARVSNKSVPQGCHPSVPPVFPQECVAQESRAIVSFALFALPFRQPNKSNGFRGGRAAAVLSIPKDALLCIVAMKTVVLSGDLMQWVLGSCPVGDEEGRASCVTGAVLTPCRVPKVQFYDASGQASLQASRCRWLWVRVTRASGPTRRVDQSRGIPRAARRLLRKNRFPREMAKSVKFGLKVDHHQEQQTACQQCKVAASP